MIRNLPVAVLAVSLALPAVSAAQGSPRRPSTRPRVRVETQGGPFGVYALGDQRGRIGVIVDTKANTAGDKVGARIEGITPGGPAEKAGIKAGDVITRFNGTALGGSESEKDERSGPGLKLIDLAHELEPGDTVQVEYRRGNDARKATLVAEDLGGGVWTGSMDMMPEMGNFEEMIPQMKMAQGEFMFGGVWGGIELVKLNPDLGEYFGTREGVLVVRAPEDSSLTLKGGDVIISIGDRKPTSPEQAMRILRSYDAGETVTLDVLRKQRHVAVSWKVPDRERTMFRRTPGMHEEPSWFRIAPKIQERMDLPLKARTVIRTSRAI